MERKHVVLLNGISQGWSLIPRQDSLFLLKRLFGDRSRFLIEMLIDVIH